MGRSAYAGANDYRTQAAHQDGERHPNAMMFDIIIISLVGILLLFAIYTVIQLRGKHPKRTIEDVTPFLRPAEHDELESLLDPALETNFRVRMSPQEFADWQRRRIHLLREYLLRMSH